jgi:type VI secretion system protein ImpN
VADEADAQFDEVARNFAALWRTLTVGKHGPHTPERRHFLIDQVRNALDRAEDRLDGNGKSILANTFALEALIHEGATTDVYRARHRDLGSLHAIKMLRPDRADDPIARRLLLREAEIGMAICHVNVVTTQTVLRLADGRPALVFEWLRHGLIQTQLPLNDLTKIATAILSGLGAIHAAGFVHGDLSPANLLCDGEDFSRLKIADFGVALETGRHHRDLDITFAGRPQFAPPEQLAGEALDARVDLYAAGRILTGLLPLCPENTDRLEAFAAELTRELPDERPENVKAAQTMLDGFFK